ncbi:MAG: CHAT domain-containing protein [bacterium]
MRDRSSLRLVFLNACLTARASSAGPYAGLATALLRAGIPAVVAMQFPISDAAAIAFSRAFYRRLAASDTVDAAVTEGRLAIHRLGRGEWATPVLFERLTTGRLFQALPGLGHPESLPKMRWSRALRALAVMVMVFAVGVLAWLGSRARPEDTKSPPAPKREQTQMKPIVGSPGTKIRSGDREDSNPQATVPTQPIGPSPMQGSDRPEPLQLPTITRQNPHPISPPRVYSLKENDAVFIQELQTWASVEFSQVGREPSVTLHLTPPQGPVMNNAILGPTVVDVPQNHGTRRLRIQSLDWAERKLIVSAQPVDPTNSRVH